MQHEPNSFELAPIGEHVALSLARPRAYFCCLSLVLELTLVDGEGGGGGGGEGRTT